MSKDNTQASNELDSRIDLRNPVIAGVLAYLIPGAGHLYQRRYFKAFVYSFCILGIFFWGSSMGEAKAVYFRFDPPQGRKKARTIGFIAQVGVGAVVLPAILQSRRLKGYEANLIQAHPVGTVIEQFDTTFTGLVADRENGSRKITNGRLGGTLKIDQAGRQTFEGTVSGNDENGKPLEVKIFGTREFDNYQTEINGELTWKSSTFQVGSKVCALDDITPANMSVHHGERVDPEFSAEKRLFIGTITDDDMASDAGRIIGTIPRSIADHYQVPIEDRAVQHLIRKKGKFFELALVYTWIAGLLNVLAVWDAVSGPAYGYGDEPIPEKKKKGAKPDDSKAKAEPAPKPDAVVEVEPAAKEVAVAPAPEATEPPASETPDESKSKDAETPVEPKES